MFSAKQMMTMVFYMSIVIAFLNVTHLIVMSVYGIDIFLYRSPLAVQDDEIRTIGSIINVGLVYGLLTWIRRTEENSD